MFLPHALNAVSPAVTPATLLEVRYGDKTVRYNTVGEMLKLRDMMQLELGVTPPTKTYGRMTVGVGEYP